MPGSTGPSLGGVDALTVRVVTRRSRPYNRQFTATVRSPTVDFLGSSYRIQVEVCYLYTKQIKEKLYNMRSHTRKRNEAWAVYLELSSMV